MVPTASTSFWEGVRPLQPAGSGCQSPPGWNRLQRTPCVAGQNEGGEASCHAQVSTAQEGDRLPGLPTASRGFIHPPQK